MRFAPLSIRLAQSRMPGISSLAIMGKMGLAGCRAATQIVLTYADHLPRPDLIVVHDFTAQPAEARLSFGLIERLKERALQIDVLEQQVELQKKITGIMTTESVQEIRKMGLPVKPAARAGLIAGRTLDIEGQFLTIDDGNRMRCLVIGFGAGASHVRAAVQVFQTMKREHRFLEDFYANAASSRKPGLGPMAGVGGATGAAAASAGVGLGATALAGRQDAESDTKEAAVAVARELARFFAGQGWITAQRAESYRGRFP